MASTPQQQPEFTDCPVCLSLCLSANILPCGHLICRKCLRNILEEKANNPVCPSCAHNIPRCQGPSISELADQMGKDPILQDLVTEQLVGQENVLCVACPTKSAIKMCLDCGEMYCEGCSNAHKRMRATKDHLQQDLPKTLPTHRPASSKLEDEFILSFESQDSFRYGHDDSQPAHNSDKECLRLEARLLKKEVSHLKEAVTVMEASMAQMHKVKNKLEKQQQLLTTYVTRLSKPDDEILANARAMLLRLKCVREDCRPPQEAALSALLRHVDCLTPAKTVQGAAPFDPMAAHPSRVFVTRPDVDGDTDKHGPWITSLVATPDGQLVMVDYRNKMVKIAKLTNLTGTVQGLTLDTVPYILALLRDGRVAITSEKKRVYIVDVSSQPTVVSRSQTARQYWGVGEGTQDDTLVVSCVKDFDGPASVDVISRAGVVLMTVINSNKLTDLATPYNLFVLNNEVLISDYDASTVFRVEMEKGRVVSRLTHPNLKCPYQVTVDRAGNCYIASPGGQCVLVVTPGKRWRRLLHASEHGDATRVRPSGVCVTDWGVVATWRNMDLSGYSVVAGYKLK